MRRILYAAALLILVGLATALLLTPAKLAGQVTQPDLPADLDDYLARGEQDAGRDFPLIRGAEKRLLWQTPQARTAWSVVYIHGFSATRQELAPVPEQVAAALGANLFETRLAGHGRAAGALVGVRAEDWLEDAAEALAIGARIGERVIVIGTSTGATLALAMAGHPAAAQVNVMVLVSPNFEPADRKAGLLTGPAGPVLARLIAGETRSWKPHNERQARFWSTSYPIDAAVEAMRLVDFTQSRLPLDLDAGLLVFLSPNDTVVSPAAARTALSAIRARRLQLVEIDSAGDPSNHVLAGEILSPDRTEEVTAAIVNFVLEAEPGAATTSAAP